MDIAFATKLAERMEAGQDIQVKGYLCSSNDGAGETFGFCAAGLACDIIAHEEGSGWEWSEPLMGANKVQLVRRFVNIDMRDSGLYSPPVVVKERLGLDLTCELMGLNDDGKTWTELAKYLRSEIAVARDVESADG